MSATGELSGTEGRGSKTPHRVRSGRPQRAGGVSGTRARAHTRGITEWGHSVTARGQPGGGVRCTEDQGGQAEEDSSYQAGPEEEAGDGGPSVVFAGAAGKPAAAYTAG